MKNFKLILVTCLCVFLFTISCDKEIISNNATPNLIQARSNAAAKLRTDIDKNFLSFDFGKYKVAPLWDLAVVFKNKKSIEVPYMIDGKLRIPSVSKTLKGRQRLLLTLSGSKVSVMIMTYIPDLTFDGNIKEISAENFKSKKFSGKIVFQSLGEEKLYIWNLEKGKIKSKVKGFIGKKRTLKVAEFRLVEVCQPYDVFYEDHETHELVYSYTEYDNCWWEDQWFDEEDDDDEDEDDGSDDDPTDCNLHPEMPWCDGDGGGDDDSDNAPKPVWANESQLKNKLCVNSNAAFHQIKTQMINDWRSGLNNAGIYDTNPDIGYDSKTNNLMFKSVSNPSKSWTAPIDFSAYDDCP